LFLAAASGLRADDGANAALQGLTAAVEVQPAAQSAPRTRNGGGVTSALVEFKRADLAGTWHFHIGLNDFYPYWVACNSVKIRRTGVVVTGSKCQVFDDFNAGIFPGTVNGGSFRLTKTGKVTGKLVVGTVDLTLEDAWMDNSKTFFHGMGAPLSTAMDLTAIKR